MKIVKVIDSLSVLWPKLVPTENIDGSYKVILDAVKEIENVQLDFKANPQEVLPLC